MADSESIAAPVAGLSVDNRRGRDNPGPRQRW
jgi:hypothetical protein